MSSAPAPTPTVPISYVRLVLDLAGELGVSADRILAGQGITDEQLLNPDARVSLRPVFSELCRRALAMTGEPALGYLFGLRASLTAHGIVGYGLMSQATLRHALTFGQQFGSVLRLSAWDLHFEMTPSHARMWAVDSMPPNDLREFSAQTLIVGACTLLHQLLPECRADTVLGFDFPEPAYHRRFAARLPTCKFGVPFNEIRVPAHYLDQPLLTADMVSAKLAERECVRELSTLELRWHNDTVRQARGLLTLTDAGYPSPQELARQMNVSSRTLARQLQAQGSSYRTLLQEARQRDSRVLLHDARLSVADVAMRLGYESATGFSRAFQGWYGMTPLAYRSTPQEP